MTVRRMTYATAAGTDPTGLTLFLVRNGGCQSFQAP